VSKRWRIAGPAQSAAVQRPAAEAIRFVLDNPHVASLVVGGLSLDHFRANLMAAGDATSRD
jgi:aryl-alcohol dehydrogenase-like predicted oxidoreductase